MSVLNKKLNITTPVLIVVIITVIVTTIIINNNSGPNPDEIVSYVDENGEVVEEKVLDKIYIKIGDEKRELFLKKNPTAAAFLKILPADFVMDDLNNNEKYTYLGTPLPTDSYKPEQIDVGDVMLYGDNCLVIFYKEFETDYEYSKIGHIDDLPEMGEESVSVSISIE